MVQDITVFNKLLTFFINKLFKPKTYQLNSRYLIKVSDYMTLNYFPLILIPSGEDP